MTLPAQPAPESPLLTVGIVSDTHVPDRVDGLHPELVPSLEKAGVNRILHAGDVCSQSVLDRLEQIAPVAAVRGNRDWALLSLPLTVRLDLAGVPTGLIHGHGGMMRYLQDKVQFYLRGYNLARYLSLLATSVPGVRVIIFGHTHFPEMLWRYGMLMFNPGSACQGSRIYNPPSFGLLRVYAGQRVEPELVYLEGYRIENHRWAKKE